MLEGKVHWHDGSLISPDSLFRPQQRVYYYREVPSESIIPFEESILFQDEHILVAYKPHFLAVTPGGSYVNECLQNRLRIKTGIHTLQALHRLDRVTAGLVLFSINKETRHLYHNLFSTRNIQKTYHAIAMTKSKPAETDRDYVVKNRIVKSEMRFRMQVTDGEPNSHSHIRCIRQNAEQGLFELQPITGKTHQLRLHMQSIGWPILYDKYYPVLQPETADVYSRPLQLLAKELRFLDPITHLLRVFISDTELAF
ncbi:MAG: tRNA pseudouridine32 synthase/23S rRNA pseudouridine746 synthase [Gammaproteobacteria bacterium]|jgi:tRNA pseudouridine32 synthase/23S rRNA pseudouridine746 synthase